VHGFLRYESWAKVFATSKDFFDRKLKWKLSEIHRFSFPSTF
jgi:hypothetical protein